MRSTVHLFLSLTAERKLPNESTLEISSPRGRHVTLFFMISEFDQQRGTQLLYDYLTCLTVLWWWSKYICDVCWDCWLKRSSHGKQFSTSFCCFSNHVSSHILWTISWIKLKLSEYFFLFAYLIVQFLFSLYAICFKKAKLFFTVFVAIRD